MSDRSNESGVTLVEVLMSASLFLLALLMFGASLVVVQRLQASGGAYSRTNDQIQLAFQSIDREVRSGYVDTVLGPAPLAAPPTGADYAVKIFTWDGASPRCTMWAVGMPAGSPPGSRRSLYRTTWDAVAASAPTTLAASSWRVIASDLWNFVPPNAIPPFVTSNPGVGGPLKVLEVRLLINAQDRSGATVPVSSTFTSRNLPRINEKIDATDTAGAAC